MKPSHHEHRMRVRCAARRPAQPSMRGARRDIVLQAAAHLELSRPDAAFCRRPSHQCFLKRFRAAHRAKHHGRRGRKRGGCERNGLDSKQSLVCTQPAARGHNDESLRASVALTAMRLPSQLGRQWRRWDGVTRAAGEGEASRSPVAAAEGAILASAWRATFRHRSGLDAGIDDLRAPTLIATFALHRGVLVARVCRVTNHGAPCVAHVRDARASLVGQRVGARARRILPTATTRHEGENAALRCVLIVALGRTRLAPRAVQRIVCKVG